MVIADPTSKSFSDVMALNDMLIQTAILQLQMVAHGFFARGALTIGPHHIHAGMVFGPAMVDAYELERDGALNPRVILSDEACEILRADMGTYNEPQVTTQADFLMVDQDGVVFIDYLKVLLDEVDPLTDLERHRKAVEEKLAQTKGSSRKWNKYRWVAEYHNNFCDRLDVKDPCIPIAEATPKFDPFTPLTQK